MHARYRCVLGVHVGNSGAFNGCLADYRVDTRHGNADVRREKRNERNSGDDGTSKRAHDAGKYIIGADSPVPNCHSLTPVRICTFDLVDSQDPILHRNRLHFSVWRPTASEIRIGHENARGPTTGNAGLGEVAGNSLGDAGACCRGSRRFWRRPWTMAPFRNRTAMIAPCPNFARRCWCST